MASDQFKGQPRLPKFALPKRYDIKLKPDLVSCKFSGVVSIDLDVVSPTKFLVLNAADLDIDSHSLSLTPTSTSQALRPAGVEVIAEDEILVAEFAAELPIGSGVLNVSFVGTLNDQMKGFYRSVYEINGEKANMAVTQFEPADARRCFPCWDEPALKVSRFVVIVKLTSQVKFALDVAVKTLELYKKYFDAPYPLPKLDMIAIPDFAAGAMENFGLVTYRDSSLLYDEQHSSATDKQWVSYLATDILFPEWKIWTQFLDETADALTLDALAESHPIEVEVNHAHEIDEIFDAISYSKGASVIRMLQSYIGAECFQRALALYIKRYTFSNAKTEDLWAVLEEESGEPVKDLMHSWTKQKGYPVVSVKLNDQKLEIEQSNFLLSGNPVDSLWIVPITFCCGSYDARRTFLMRSKSEAVDVKENAWLKVNVDQTGFYRVKYDENLTVQLRSAIERNLLSPIDRLGALDDSYALCKGCQLPLTSLLTLIGSFREELDYTVVSNLISISYQVIRIVTDAAPETVGFLKQFFIHLFQFSAG
ncbi:LOW QUALITY PROTEIN: hypothetical protein Cgig2_016293 [Carnegiea gigantea]|uniref:Aminopeptidase n=1 Tax=Carnegiea gigantea TaxID=171969 RepID=A0A9Q1QHX1_9CARY|nr:LOW QUALITY PROTEIN: hypothetical protein Cgig2_016293 [Carnegiea gigantea]